MPGRFLTDQLDSSGSNCRISSSCNLQLPKYYNVIIPELQIRRDMEDNSKIIFSYYSTKTYVIHAISCELKSVRFGKILSEI